MRASKKILRKGKPRFAFVVDGECEFWYIQMLKRNERAIAVDLIPEIPQKKKLAEQYERVVELAGMYDKVFWIVDFDVIMRETYDAKAGEKTRLQEFKGYYESIGKKHGKIITVIINNPCLEYWYLLHFESTSRYYDSGDKVIKQLHKFFPDYIKTRGFYTKQNHDIYLKLKPNLKTAIANANRLGAVDFANPQQGISQMQLLFEEKGIVL